MGLDTNNLDIEEFDLSNITPDSGVGILGKTHCGKSVLMYLIMYSLSKHFNYGKAMSPTLSSRKKFESCMPLHFIDNPSVDELTAFISVVKETYIDEDRRGQRHRRSYFIADDTAFDKQFMGAKVLKDLMMNGRNYNCFRMLVLQYICGIGPDLRSNLDYLFVFWHNSKRDQRAIYETWFSMMDRKVFNLVFAKATENYGCLVIDMRKANTTRDWHNCVYWFRVPEKYAAGGLPEFRMCDDDFFNISRRVIVREHEQRQRTAGETVRLIDVDGNVQDP
jgi:hypothetical protein